jgi:hypothetical protein
VHIEAAEVVVRREPTANDYGHLVEHAGLDHLEDVVDAEAVDALEHGGHIGSRIPWPDLPWPA